MNVVVIVKQVPDITKIKIDREQGTLIRRGVPSVLNPYCEWALEQAVAVKRQVSGTTVYAVTMGPPSAKEVLIRAIALGADKAILLSDRLFAGADCRATAYTLAQAIRSEIPDVDIIFAGKQAVDGDTAQVPPELSVFLSRPFVANVIDISVENQRDYHVTVETSGYREKLSVTAPFVCSVGTGSRVRRPIVLSDLRNALHAEIEVKSAMDIGCDSRKIGLRGSPTRVVKIENVISHRGGNMFRWSEPAERVKAVQLLRDIF